MNKDILLKKLPKIVLIAGVLICVVFLFIYFSSLNTTNNNSDQLKITDTPKAVESVNTDSPMSFLTITQKFEIEQEKIKAVSKVFNPVTSLKNTGWIPDWDLADGFSTLKAYGNKFESVSPFWLMPQEDGHLKEVLNAVNPEIINYTKSNNIKLIPTITLFDADLFSTIFEDSSKYQILLSDTLEKVDKYGYDGIDLDFEEIKLENKDIFFSFLKDLKSELHNRNKVLVFTALTKWSDILNYIGHPQTRAVQDYRKIAEIVDELRLMTYDYSGRDSTEAGPIAPLEWMERVIQYAIYVEVPREKIVLGIPTYAYDWSDRATLETINLSSDNAGLGSLLGLEPGDAYYHKAVDSVMANYDLNYSFNTVWGEAIGRYNYQGKSRIVVFPTDESIQLRKQLAADYGIKGVAFWRLGDEGTLRL